MKRIYLTGIAASGKSTLTYRLKEHCRNIKIISYSDLLLQYLEKKDKSSLEHSELRQKSSTIITPEDINYIDQMLLDIVNKESLINHVLIDSHAITNEAYGFRATPFNVDILEELKIDLFFSLYAESEEIQQRIDKNPQGRKKASNEAIIQSISLQNSLVLTYGILTNKPVYFLDASRDFDTLVSWIISKLTR